MLGNLEQLDDTSKTGIARKCRCHISEGDLEYLRDDDLAGRQGISAADFHARSLPQANGSGDLASTNALAKASKELHVQPVFAIRLLRVANDLVMDHVGIVVDDLSRL